MLSVQFPDQLAHELIGFARDVNKAETPQQVLNSLHAVTSTLPPQINVWVTMRFPDRLTDWEALELDKTVFIHKSTPVGWWLTWIERVKMSQPLYYTLSRISLAPFTATEALKMLDPIGADRWSAEVAARFGIRDGFFCPIGGRWVLAFWSSKILLDGYFTPETRILLEMAAKSAILHINRLTTAANSSLQGTLTPRELAVLRQLSIGFSSKEVSEHLGIGEETIKTHIQKAQIKLDTKNRVHTVSEAMRRHLIG